MQYIFSFSPVILFLLCLYLFDSFKLVRRGLLILSLSWGIIAAVAAYYLNTQTAGALTIPFEAFSRYLAPVSEEILKALFVILLISRKKVGFIIDASVYGFAAGTGFALAENLVYIIELQANPSTIVWILRGFGTALMHGGNTALLAMLLITGLHREKPFWVSLFPALLFVIILHSIFNHFVFSPLLQTLFLLIVMPLFFITVFARSNKMVQEWLEIEFSSEAEILGMIRRGAFSKTKAGVYLERLKKHFPPEVIFDIYCYISLYLELSIKAKRNLMLRESGLEMVREPDIENKLVELHTLRRAIGKAGELAIQPLIRMKQRELWKLNLLKK